MGFRICMSVVMVLSTWFAYAENDTTILSALGDESISKYSMDNYLEYKEEIISKTEEYYNQFSGGEVSVYYDLIWQVPLYAGEHTYFSWIRVELHGKRISEGVAVLGSLESEYSSPGNMFKFYQLYADVQKIFEDPDLVKRELPSDIFDQVLGYVRAMDHASEFDVRALSK